VLKVPYLSLPERRGHILLDSIIMAVRAYFDGSGSGKYVCLACRAASQKIWEIIQPKWISILAHHFKDKRLCIDNEVIDAPYLHMKEAMERTGQRWPSFTGIGLGVTPTLSTFPNSRNESMRPIGAALLSQGPTCAERNHRVSTRPVRRKARRTPLCCGGR
jgi:hypothetical protein